MNSLIPNSVTLIARIQMLWKCYPNNLWDRVIFSKCSVKKATLNLNFRIYRLKKAISIHKFMTLGTVHHLQRMNALNLKINSNKSQKN